MLDIKPLSEDLQKIAIEELGEVPSRIPEYLKALNEWLASQPHLKARTDDQFLIQFLRCCKYDMAQVKAMLDLYFTLKTKYPEMFNVTHVDDPKFRQVSQWGHFMTLPVPLHGNGPRILAYQFTYPTEGFTIYDILQTVTALHDMLIMNDPYACIHGVIYIIDFSRATPSHYQQLTTEFVKICQLFLESMPLRIKSIIYLNMKEDADDKLNPLISSFSEKTRTKLSVLSDNGYETLKDIIPLKYLPREFNGEQPSLVELAADYNRVWNANREFFKKNALYGTNEKLRPQKPFDLESYFDAKGSFKSL